MHRLAFLAALLLPATVYAQAVTFTAASVSGTITTGGVAQVAAPFNSGRKGCTIQNQSTGDLWINDLGAATLSQPSIRVPAGAQYVCGVGAGGAPNSALSIIGATTGQAFAGREW